MICEKKLDPFIGQDMFGGEEGVEETDDKDPDAKDPDAKEVPEEKEEGDDMGEEI